MNSVKTILGDVEINSATINRASGYGQYTINVEYSFEGQNKTLSIHSTDSQLFDKAHGEDNHSQIVMEDARYTIECAINDHINSL